MANEPTVAKQAMKFAESHFNAYENCHRLLERRRREVAALKDEIKDEGDHAKRLQLQTKLTQYESDILRLEATIANYSPASRMKKMFEIAHRENQQPLQPNITDPKRVLVKA